MPYTKITVSDDNTLIVTVENTTHAIPLVSGFTADGFALRPRVSTGQGSDGPQLTIDYVEKMPGSYPCTFNVSGMAPEDIHKLVVDLYAAIDTIDKNVREQLRATFEETAREIRPQPVGVVSGKIRLDPDIQTAIRPHVSFSLAAPRMAPLPRDDGDDLREYPPQLDERFYTENVADNGFIWVAHGDGVTARDQLPFVRVTANHVLTVDATTDLPGNGHGPGGWLTLVPGVGQEITVKRAIESMGRRYYATHRIVGDGKRTIHRHVVEQMSHHND